MISAKFMVHSDAVPGTQEHYIYELCNFCHNSCWQSYDIMVSDDGVYLYCMYYVPKFIELTIDILK